ncbi:hypothetical protein QJS10_CPA16g00149 [Acorus calamus]|uniref:DUF223 domain-containing protein n=1 Tax=Acorus calamus TaxID=4465 RepID=A0AAV9D0I6_ACOCL|nr:hypothetical protein QJS10_CPA16g00149 [Acorus calamus]
MQMDHKKEFCIMDINQTTKNWKIKVQVLEKLPPKKARNSPTEYQTIILADAKGSKIQAKLFNEDIKFFDNHINTNQIYYISDATVQHIDEKYRLVQNERQLKFNRYTKVEQVSEELFEPEHHQYHFVFLENLPDLIKQGICFDVLVLVIKVEDIRKLDKSDAIVRRLFVVDKRYAVRIRLTDESTSTWVTLFNETAQNLLQHKAEDFMKIDLQATDQATTSKKRKLVHLDLDNIINHEYDFTVKSSDALKIVGTERLLRLMRQVFNISWKDKGRVCWPQQVVVVEGGGGSQGRRSQGWPQGEGGRWSRHGGGGGVAGGPMGGGGVGTGVQHIHVDTCSDRSTNLYRSSETHFDWASVDTYSDSSTDFYRLSEEHFDWTLSN